MVYRTCYYQTRRCYRRRRSRPTRIFLDRTELGKYFPSTNRTDKQPRQLKRKSRYNNTETTACNMLAVKQCVTDTLDDFSQRYPSVKYVCVQNSDNYTTNCTHIAELAENECISDACVYRINPIY
jgi:hypothetical protein